MKIFYEYFENTLKSFIPFLSVIISIITYKNLKFNIYIDGTNIYNLFAYIIGGLLFLSVCMVIYCFIDDFSLYKHFYLDKKHNKKAL